MGRDDPGGVEFLDGDDRPPAAEEALETTTPRRMPRWLPIAALALLLAGIGGYAATRGNQGAPSAVRSPSISAPPITVSTAAAPTGDVDTALPGPAVTVVGHPLLGGGDWNLFGLGDGVLARIEPGAGRVTMTPVPALQSSGPASVVATTDGVIVQPNDFVTGYRVPDGGGPVALGTPFDAGTVLPGPDDRSVWVASQGGPPSLVLLTIGGAAPGTPPRITLPADSSPLAAVPDGAGYAMFAGIDGWYDATPAGVHRITTGSVIAAGPSGWLVVECDDGYHCALYRVARADRSRERIPASAGLDEFDQYGLGVIAPDGSVAAVVGYGSRLLLLDLASGSVRPVARFGSLAPDPQALAWSPDSRWLFALDSSGSLAVVDPRSAVTSDPGFPIPALSEICVRGGE